MRFTRLSVVLSAAILAGCSRTGTAPSDASPERRLDGVTVNAIDGAPAGGLTVQVGTARGVTTDAAGYFTTEIAGPGQYAAVVSGSGIVERRTTVTGPASERARLTLVPASFDLQAFDEMFRTSNARLQRWTTRPMLVVVASVMSYRGQAESYVATSEAMSDGEVSLLVSHLTEGLEMLTGGRHTTFADVQIERPAAGERTSIARAGAIVVGRYDGVKSLAGTVGYGQWAEQEDGTIGAGAMFLDHGFDRDDQRRRLLRIHELGHALGLTHVESRPSIMNPALGAEPTEFDRQAAVIAFQRPPGNVAPDTDPASASRWSAGSRVRWAAPVGCRLGQ
jgi:hypothetical protein